jgi:hypothetical protein
MTATPLHVGTFTKSLLIDLARSTGKFEAAGLEVQETSVVSSPAQFRSLAEGEYDLVLTSPDNVIAYRYLSANPLGTTLPVQILAGIDRGVGLSLCVAPMVDDMDDVRGQTVGVDVPQSGFAFVALALLARAGLEPGDYSLESLGSTPRRAEALAASECLATVLNAGNELRARGQGCHIIRPVTELGPYLGTVIARMEQPDPDLTAGHLRFVDVMLTMSREILDGQWEDEVIESAIRLLGLTDQEARAHRDCLLDPLTGLIPDGVVDGASVRTLIDLRRAYRPSDELDRVAEQWPAMLAEQAQENMTDTRHA